MKKKPELFKRTGNSSLTLRNFLNNLKENDLHYENKQITQCVFLGVLRLKPVPTIFSNNNVPSVSAQKVNNRSKRIRNNNSNKELNKNVSKKIDINKVLGGKVTKKNTQKVKATVKKTPTKKPNLVKIKLGKDKKKTNNDKKTIPNSANNKQEAISISSESSKALKTLTPDAIIARPTITLNTIISPTKFNPVQSLFEKLKQKIDEGYNEPGPSTTVRQHNKTKEALQALEAAPKVCKINAKRQGTPNSTNKKPKKAVNKKHELHDCLTNPTQSISPITISDTESTDKKDKDDVIVIEDNNLLNIQGVTETDRTEVVSEDIIFVNDDSNLTKSKESASPRSKILFRAKEKQKSVDSVKKRIILINEQQKLVKSKDHPQDLLALTNTNSNQLNEVIVIPDEPKSGLSDTCEDVNDNTLANEDSRGHRRNDIIVIDEVREIRMSPRSKKVDEVQKHTREVHISNGNLRDTNTNEVICITDETKKVQTNKMLNKTASNGPKCNSLREVLMNKSNSEQLNIAIEEQHSTENRDKVAMRPVSLLKIIDTKDNTSIRIKNELIESKSDVQEVNVSEKPKQRRSKLKATLIPPMLLNAPMLLRSELAPKKTNTTLRERDKPRGAKIRQKSASKLEGKGTKNSPTKLITNNTGRENLKNAKLHEAPFRSQSLPLIHYKRPKDLPLSVSSFKNNTGNEEVIIVPDQDNMINSKEKCSVNLPRTEIIHQNGSAVSSEKLTESDNQEVVLTEVTTQTANRLLRSDIHQTRTPESSIQRTNVEVIIINGDSSSRRKLSPLRLKVSKNSKEISAGTQDKNWEINTQEDQDVVVIMDEIESSEKTSPRLLRSDFTKKKVVTSTSSDELELGNDTTKKIVQGESSKHSNIHIFDQNIPEKHDIGVIANISKPLEVQTTTVDEIVENAPVEVDDQIIIVKDDSKLSENGSPKTIQSICKNKANTTEDLSIDENETLSEKVRTSPRLLRSELALQKSTSKSPQNAKQIDLDEIVVVNEKHARKQKNKTCERLLRSDLARESLPEKADLEEVVVLIHDEPKQRNRTSPKTIPAESEQTNKKKIYINEIIVLSEQTKRERFPRTLKSDAGQKDGSAKTSPKTLNVEETRNSPSRLLRSHHSPKQISVKVTDEESQNQISPRLRSEMSSQRSPQNFQINKMKESKPISPRSLRSDIAQNLPKEQSSPPDTNPTAVQKVTTPPRTLRSDNTSETTLEVPADQSNIKSTSIKLRIIKPVSSRLRRSEPVLQKSTQKDQPQFTSPEGSSKKIRRSPATKDISVVAQSKAKLKTPMLLRSELAQLKNGEADGPESEEKDVPKKKNIRSKLRLLPNVPDPSSGKKSEAKPKRKSLIDDLKKKKSANLQQITNSNTSNSSPELPIENLSPPHLNHETKIGNSAVDVEQVKKEESSVKCENNVEEGAPNKSKATKNKTTNKRPSTDTPTSSPESKDLEINSETSPKQNRKRLSAKRNLKTKEVVEKQLTPEKPVVSETIQQQEISINSPKKVDTTVFDFDESEPEVVPLRLNASPKRTRQTKIAVEEPQEVKHVPSSGDVTTPKAKKQKVSPIKSTKDDPKTKAQAKAKLIAMFNEKSPQKNIELPETPLKEKSTKSKTPSKIKKASLNKSLTSSKQNEEPKTKRKSKKSLDIPNVSPSKSSPKKQTSINASKKQTSVKDDSKGNTSPMKQTTITDMFSKAPVKKETTTVVDSIFESSNESVSEEESAKENTSDNTITEMPRAKRERKVVTPSKNEEVTEDDMYDDDSDCESRIEWMPEEYAEYKFKYSAKKMMSYKPIHKCKICLLILPSYYRLSKHKKEHAKKPNPYNCTQCDQAFPSIEDLTAHLRIHKGDV